MTDHLGNKKKYVKDRRKAQKDLKQQSVIGTNDKLPWQCICVSSQHG